MDVLELAQSLAAICLLQCHRKRDVFVLGNLLINFYAAVGGDYSLTRILALALPLVVLLMGFALSVLVIHPVA